MSNRLIFLGTGPVGGVSRQGKTKRRLETSTLIKTEKGNILIDVSEDFKKQAKLINKIDAILITHGHRDAIGGISQLRNAAKTQKPDLKSQKLSKIPLYTLSRTIQIIRKKFKQTDFLEFHSLKPFKSFQLFAIKIIPFKVKHSIQKGFPTLGFKFYFPNKFVLTYISDAGGWDKKVQKLIEGSDLLVLDGAMWGKKLIAHLDIKEVLPKVKNWEVKKVIFTQIGKSAPSYRVLKKEIKKIWSKALPAYDGMEVLLKK